jgi:probable F420-dependent oxidoreductase
VAAVKIGVVFPQTEIGADPGGIRAYAQAAQDLGYEYVLAFDHVLGADPAGHPGWAGPYTHKSMFHEPFALFAFLAGVAPGLELATGVVILPQRQTALVAKQAAEIDVLTGGRFRLGVGIGWNPVEYEALGKDFGNRARRFEEQIALLRRLFTEPVVTFRGEYERVTAAGLNPLPIQRPIPIWIGGAAAPALRRAAEIADGFMPLLLRGRPAGTETWPQMDVGPAEMVETMRGWMRAAGRDPAAFGFDPTISVGRGGPDGWRREVDEWRTAGATHLRLNTMGGGLVGPDAHIERLREARETVR